MKETNSLEHLAKAAYDVDRHQRLSSCGKAEYAGLMTKWEDIGEYNKDVWRAIVIKVINEFLRNSIRKTVDSEFDDQIKN